MTTARGWRWWVIQTAALLVAITSIVTLVGWWRGDLGLVSFWSGQATMKSVTAFALLALAAALALAVISPGSRWRHQVAAAQLALVAFAVGIACIDLIEQATGWESGMNEAFAPDPFTARSARPGAMSAATSYAIVSVGLSLGMVRWRPTWAQRTVIPGAVFGLTALVGLAYGVQATDRWDLFTTMARHTAGSVTLLAVGVLSVQPDVGIVAQLLRRSPGSSYMRRSLVVVIPGVLVFGGVLARIDGSSDPRFALALLATTVVVLSAGAMWRSAAALDLAASQREDLLHTLEERVEERTATLAASERRFRTTVDSSPTAIMVSDADARIQLVNPRWTEMFGRSADEAIGESMFEFYAPEIRATIADQMEVSVRDASMWTRDLVLPRDDGSVVHLQGRRVPLFDDEGTHTGWISAAEDVTDRVHALTEAQRAQAELERSNADLTTFAGAASHDLKAPMVTISGFASLLRRRYIDVLDDSGVEYLDFIIEGTDRLRDLVDGMLTYARVGQASYDDVVDVGALVHEVWGSLAGGAHAAGASLTVDGAAPDVPGNRTQMTMLVQNLLANAIKFRVTGVRPDIRINLSASVDADGDSVMRMDVADNGIGIDRKHREQVFAMFERLHGGSDYEGAGLGLALCRRIVERHEGTISVIDGAVTGTTFRVAIPTLRAEIRPAGITIADRVAGGERDDHSPGRG